MNSWFRLILLSTVTFLILILGVVVVYPNTAANGIDEAIGTGDEDEIRFVAQKGISSVSRGGVFASGEHLFVRDTGSGRLKFFDISVPSQPILIGSIDIFQCSGLIIVSDGRLYLTCGGDLLIYDVSNLSQPRIIGVIAEFDTSRFTVDNHLLYIVFWSGLEIFDVSEPAAPESLGTYALDGLRIRQVVVSDDYAYLTDQSGLTIIDVSNASELRGIGRIEGNSGSFGGIYLDGKYIYAKDAEGLKLHIIDISDAGNPFLVGTYEMPGTMNFIYDFSYADDHVYIATQNGLSVVDVSDRSSPQYTGWLAGILPTWVVTAVDVQGVFAYITCDSRGIRVVDISTPESPSYVGQIESPGYVTDVLVRDNVAYVSGERSGIYSIDVSDLGSISDMGYFEGLIPKKLAFYDHYLYGFMSSDGSAPNRIDVFDISNPNQITKINSVLLSDYAIDRVAFNENLYVLHQEKLTVYDVSDPRTPTEQGVYDFVQPVQSLSIQDGYAFVGAAAPMGLLVLDIRRPDDIHEIGRFDEAGGVYDVVVNDGYAYLSVDSELQIIDVSDLDYLFTVGKIDMPWGVREMTIRGDHIYVAAGREGGIRLIDISDPTTPTEIDDYDTPGTALSVEVVDDLLYVSDGAGGLLILKHIRELGADDFEFDDLCSYSGDIYKDGVNQIHTFHESTDVDWVQFQADADATYLVEAHPPLGSPADLVLELYDSCDGIPQDGQGHVFSPGVRLTFTASEDGPIYLKLFNQDPGVAGAHVAYNLSVRDLGQPVGDSALILVAGRLRATAETT